MKVSVCMITYNHEKFIEEAINGVLMQECEFDMELVLVNDCSPDRTDEVIQNVLKTHPKSSVINYIKHETNIGMMLNFIFALQQCKGEYIALCDGDDYWTDSLKLKKQIDFLDKNSDYSLVYTLKKNLIKNKGLIADKVKNINKRVATVSDLCNDNFIPASSTMFRNIIQNVTFPKWLYYSPYGDWPLFMLLTQNGEKINCLLNYTLVYRKNLGALNEMKINKRSVLENTYNLFTNIYNDIIFLSLKGEVNYKLYKIKIQLMKSYNKDKKYLKAFKKYQELRRFKLNKEFLPKPIFKIYIVSIMKGFK